MQPEYLVQAFQNIMSAAPAFAFDIALKVLCEQCYEIKSTLESIANLVNQMAMDECGAARALANAAGNYVTNKLQEAGYKGSLIGSTWDDSKLQTIQQTVADAKKDLEDFYSTEFCGWTADEHSVLGPCKTFANICAGPKSFWTDVARLEAAQATGPDNPFFGCSCSDSGCDNCNFLYLVTGLFGDLIVAPWGSKDGILGEVAMNYEPPRIKKDGIQDLFQRMLSQDGALQIDGMQFIKNDENSYSINYVTLSDSDLAAIQFGKKANNAIEEIINAFKDGTSTISSSTIEFINEQALPLWKIINMFSLRHEWDGNIPEKQILVKFAAVGNALAFLRSVTDMVDRYFARYMNTLNRTRKKCPMNPESFEFAVQEMRKRIRDFRWQVNTTFEVVAKNMKEKLTNAMAFTTHQRWLGSLLKSGYYTERIGN